MIIMIIENLGGETAATQKEARLHLELLQVSLVHLHVFYWLMESAMHVSGR